MYEFSITANPQQKLFSKSAKTSPFSKPPLLPTPLKPAKTSKPKKQTTRNLTPAYMSEMNAKGLCYFCVEPFTPEHFLTHKKLQIHVMEVDDNSDSEVEDVVSEELVVSSASEPLISVNALTRTTSFGTMRVTGYYRKKTPSYPH